MHFIQRRLEWLSLSLLQNYFSDAVIGLSVMGSAEHSEGDDLTYCVNAMAQNNPGAILRMVMYNIDFNGITAGEITAWCTCTF